jgi:hypothetical protein
MALKKLAAESGFSYTSLRDAHFRGELAVIKIGRAWYVDLTEFARWIESRTERLDPLRGPARAEGLD